jgi:hypothetical protein
VCGSHAQGPGFNSQNAKEKMEYYTAKMVVLLKSKAEIFKKTF